VTDFINLNIKSTQFFGGSDSGKMCVPMLIGVSGLRYMSICVCSMFVKRENMHVPHQSHLKMKIPPGHNSSSHPQTDIGMEISKCKKEAASRNRSNGNELYLCYNSRCGGVGVFLDLGQH
jgi:hypothetical protein